MASEKFEAPDLQKFIAALRPDADHLDDLWRKRLDQLGHLAAPTLLDEVPRHPAAGRSFDPGNQGL